MTQRRPYVVLALVALALGAYLAVLSARAGIYADDAGFYRTYLATDFLGKLQAFWTYVPGRNLHMIWQYLAYALTVWTPGEFAGYHVTQSLIFALNAWLLGSLLLRLQVRLLLAVLTMLLCGVWPTYVDVLLWPSALPMHLLSTSFILGLSHAMIWSWRAPVRWTPIALMVVFCALATFTYDQGASAALFLVGAWLVAGGWRASRTSTWDLYLPRGLVVIAATAIQVVVYVYLILYARPSSSGPVVNEGVAKKILQGLDNFSRSVGLERVDTMTAKGWWLYLESVWALRLLFLLALIVIVVGSFRASRSTEVDRSLQIRVRWILAGVVCFFGASIAAFGPAWAWWVSPRHTYLPMVFILLAYGIAFEGLLVSFRGRVKAALQILVALTLGITCLSSVIGLSSQAADWQAREETRKATYLKVASLIAGLPNGSSRCVKFLAVDVTAPGPFYSESMGDALNLYARDPMMPGCPQPWLPEETGCAPGYFPVFDTTSSYVRFPFKSDGSRDWLGAELFAKCE